MQNLSTWITGILVNTSQSFHVSLDVVYIGTIQPHHLSAGKLFMKSKKNVLIEKPLAMNLREVQELITAAQDNSVFLMEVTTYRLNMF